MKPVTRWCRLNPKTSIYEHNHLEDGHTLTDTPAVMKAEQVASWSGSKWRKQFGYLDDNSKFIPMIT